MDLDEQYEIIRCIHESADTKVYLVRHILLDSVRLLKQVKKSVLSTKAASGEALILCKLRHPGIPVLYDFREDDDSICLIEEYVRGMSLSEYLASKKALSMKEAIRYVTMIGDILIYLHSQKPYPILYRDLKPEHIIIRNGQPVLIDYGIALLKGIDSGIDAVGTPGHSAPEQFEHKPLDESCDIYALGVVARELITATGEQPDRIIAKLIHDATMEEPAKRPSSVEEWCEKLRRLQVGAEGGGHLCKKISVIGTDEGVGTTHIAISLCAVLNHMGQRAFYIDRSRGSVMQHILRNRPEYAGRNGIIYHGDFAGVLDKGPCLAEIQLPEGIYIIDCGTDQKEADETDIVLYVCSTRAWQDGRPLDELVRQPHCYPILNPPDIADGIRFARELGRRVYAFPIDRDPFSLTREKTGLFGSILRKEGFLSARM